MKSSIPRGWIIGACALLATICSFSCAISKPQGQVDTVTVSQASLERKTESYTRSRPATAGGEEVAEDGFRHWRGKTPPAILIPTEL
jgi:hypothetical protein